MNRTKIFICTITVLAFMAFSQISYGQTIIELDGIQSMHITGKGIGQDAVLNPFNGNDSYEIIKNIAGAPFEARVQKDGKVIETYKVLRGKEVKIKLLKKQELYFDSSQKAKASVKFEKVE